MMYFGDKGDRIRLPPNPASPLIIITGQNYFYKNHYFEEILPAMISRPTFPIWNFIADHPSTPRLKILLLKEVSSLEFISFHDFPNLLWISKVGRGWGGHLFGGPCIFLLWCETLILGQFIRIYPYHVTGFIIFCQLIYYYSES